MVIPKPALANGNFRAIYDNAPCCFVICSAQGLVMHSNDLFLQTAQYSAEEVWQKRFFPELFSAGFKLFFENHLFPLLHMQGGFREIAADLIRKDSAAVPVLINGTWVHEEGGSFLYFSIFDASQRRMYEEELLLAKRKAEALNSALEERNQALLQQQEIILQQKQLLEQLINAKNRFFGIVAHDLRSPIGQLSAFTQLIEIYIRQQRYELLPEMCREIDRSLNNTLKLMDNMVAWSRSLKESLDPERQLFDLQEVVNDVYDLYNTIASDKNITLTRRVIRCQLYADKSQVAFILRNLVDNAIKFTPIGGVVSVNVGMKDFAVLLSVTDTGGGIPEEIRRDIFSTERKYKSAGTNGERGTGLGLILTHLFVEKNDGKISLTSSRSGTTFEVAFPVVDDLA